MLDQHRSPDRPAATNARRIVEALRLGQPMARVELVEATSLSPATVTAATQALITAGLVEKTTGEEEAPSEKSETRRGRPRVLLQLRPDALFVAGVKVSMHQISVSVTNFVGGLVGARTVDFGASRAPTARLVDWIDDALRQGVAAAGLGLADIHGVGMALPGFVDSDAGVCHWSPVLEDPMAPISDRLRERLALPVFIDNDANMATLAEQWFGAGKGVSNFLVVTLEHGVGMGAVVGGRLYRGARGFGGEFGHLKIQRSGALCRCGQRGCIEAYLADYAILREASAFRPIDGLGDPARAYATLQELIADGKSGDARIRQIYERAGDILGLGIANLVNLFGPELVVLTGAGVSAAPLFEDAMRKALDANTLSAAAGRFPLVIRPNEDTVWAHGAAALVLERMELT